jgi:glycosyltransferase involved in cell wall biosynthesis
MVIAILSWHLLEHPFLKLKGSRKLPAGTSGNGVLFRTLLLTDADVFAGTERHILSLATALKTQGVAVAIGCPVPSPLAERAAQEGITVISIPKRGLIDWRAAKQLRQLAKAHKVQIIHAHNGRTTLAAAIGLRGLCEARLVSSQHFLQPARLRRRGVVALISRTIHHWMNGRIHRFVAVSNAVAQSLDGQAHAQRVRVVPNGVAACDGSKLHPREDLRRELGIAFDTPLLVCAARLEPEKDIATLITAMAEVCKRFPNSHCVIAGRGSMQQTLADQIDRLGLNDHVRLLGFCDDALSLINAGDCFVLPSLAEPFGLVLLEAMSLGKPVIATRAGGPLEIVEDGITGLLVPPSDAQALSAAMIQVLADRAAAAEMGRLGKARFEAQFTDRKMAEAMNTLYEELIHDPR